jgi:hypothetical protein
MEKQHSCANLQPPYSHYKNKTTLKTMTKKEEKKYAESTIEMYLERIQALTGDYLETLELLEREPKEILFMRNDELKYYLSVIKMCMQSVMLKKMEVKYTGSEFKVKLKTY